MRNSLNMNAFNYLENLAKHAIDRSHGQCVDINIEYFASEDLLHYITEKYVLLLSMAIGITYALLFYFILYYLKMWHFGINNCRLSDP